MLDDFEYRHLRPEGESRCGPNTDIGKALTLEDLFRDGYKAVFIGTGRLESQHAAYQGVKVWAMYILPSITCKTRMSIIWAAMFVIIGAGNAAMDVARTAIRHGNTGRCSAFPLSKKLAASDYESSYARLEGVEFLCNKKPVEITENGVILRDLTEAEDGTLTEIPGTEMLYPGGTV